MKFKLTTVAYFYPNEINRKNLEKLGFEFKLIKGNYSKVPDEITIEINTLEELINFTKEYGEIIISENRMQIFDGYL